ncbi:hypothetical protein [Mycolicibacterium gadium]|uniref:Uncharacterized protein n=1 Tax=Mycolicibacterium gadium TaxID=1794 RepID=A0A7I7WJN0_MYCGU|nr:hypothetical protein [Mycolicibacterium gadium]BBZ17152.1 hypothetical protein MGAD_14870 [Mycolicibacterium gadium]
MKRTQPDPTCKDMVGPAPRQRWAKADTLVVAEWLAAHDWQPLDTATCTRLGQQLGRTVKAVHAKGQALRTLHPNYDRPPMNTSPLDAEVVDQVLHRR